MKSTNYSTSKTFSSLQDEKNHAKSGTQKRYFSEVGYNGTTCTFYTLKNREQVVHNVMEETLRVHMV